MHKEGGGLGPKCMVPAKSSEHIESVCMHGANWQECQLTFSHLIESIHTETLTTIDIYLFKFNSIVVHNHRNPI